MNTGSPCLGESYTPNRGIMGAAVDPLQSSGTGWSEPSLSSPYLLWDFSRYKGALAVTGHPHPWQPGATSLGPSRKTNCLLSVSRSSGSTTSTQAFWLKTHLSQEAD